jgi:hypothetical protein
MTYGSLSSLGRSGWGGVGYVDVFVDFSPGSLRTLRRGRHGGRLRPLVSRVWAKPVECEARSKGEGAF